MPLVTLRSVQLSFGGAPVLAGVDLAIDAGDRLCLIGRNGAGKSSLLKMLAGEILPDGGEIVKQQGLSIASVPQEIPPGMSGAVFDVVAGGMGEVSSLLAEYHRLGERIAADGSDELLKRFEALQVRLEESGGWELGRKVEQVLNRLSLSADAEFSTLSGGTKRRVLLARALVSSPDLLLLDEPTNHLDIDTIIWMEEFLQKNVRTMMFITHDRALARRLASRVAELDRGRLFCFSCGYDDFVTRRESLLEAEVVAQAAFDAKLAQEEAWIRQGIKARRTRNEGRVRALEKMREERRQRRDRVGGVKMIISSGDRSGQVVAEAENVSFGYGSAPVIRGFSASVQRGDRVGIIGPNGSGKTTLLRLLLGDLQPDEGEIRLGTRRQVIYFDQMREQLDPEKSVFENVGEGNETVTVNGKTRHLIGYLKDFLFSADRARSPVRILSGGERNRLLLAKLFTKPSNVIVLDEPTNDLDAETLDLLEEILLEYPGTVLLVSHDRDFLNNVVTSTFVFSGNGVVREYVGGYDDWLRQRETTPVAIVSREEKGAAKGKGDSGNRKLSWKEQRELESLPDRIAELEGEIEGIHRQLADPSFYRDGGSGVATAKERLEEVERELGEAYVRWEELESRALPS